MLHQKSIVNVFAVILLSGSLGWFVQGAAQVPAMQFRVSTIGYHPLGSKIAYLEDVPANRKVVVTLFDPTLRNPSFPVLLGATVYKILPATLVNSPSKTHWMITKSSKTKSAKQDKTQAPPPKRIIVLDFSKFKTPGTYELRLEGSNLKSEPVKISPYLYWDTLKPVVKMFYFQRCGQDIQDKIPDIEKAILATNPIPMPGAPVNSPSKDANDKAGDKVDKQPPMLIRISHDACHMKDALYLANEKTHRDDVSVDVVGGWHNGGDYSKYVTSTALSAAELMAMHEWSALPFRDFRLDYPLFEPGYGTIDDLHHEIKVGLDWLLAMQRPDGALYRKVAGLKWPGNVPPEEDEQPRYLFGMSTEDTANAAATWAIAARDFKHSDLGYSIKSLLAAENAWSFLESRPISYVQRSPEHDFSGSGEFIDPKALSDSPYRLWAAAELYVSTGKTKYQKYFLQHLNEVSVQRISWRNPALQGMMDYLLYAKDPDAQAVTSLKSQIIQLADIILQSIQTDPNGVGLSEYGLASNEEIAQRGITLLMAYRLSNDIRYREASSRSLSYLFGLNPLGMTYVTGMGGQSVSNPTHHWMLALGKVIPGFLVDGPNEFATDGRTPKGQGILSYTDQASASSVNEAHLLNNAALAYWLTLLNDAYNPVTADAAPHENSPLDFELAPDKTPPSKTKK